jgi:hypothetical protein
MAEVFFMAAVDDIDSKEKEYAQKQFSLVTSQGRKISEAIGITKFKLICATDSNSKATSRVLADFSSNSLQKSSGDSTTAVLPIEDSRLDAHTLNLVSFAEAHRDDNTHTVFVLSLNTLKNSKSFFPWVAGAILFENHPPLLPD